MDKVKTKHLHRPLVAGCRWDTLTQEEEVEMRCPSFFFYCHWYKQSYAGLWSSYMHAQAHSRSCYLYL